MLTARGWAVLGATAGCYLGSRVLGLTQLSVLAVAAAMVTGGAARLRSVHKSHPRILAADRRLIADAEAHVAGAEAVDLAAFASPAEAAPPASGSDRSE